MDLAYQTIVQGKSLGCVDWLDVAMSAAAGCGGGSIASKLWKSAKDLATNALPCANSLVKETLVHTETGLKPIQNIQIGEKVLSFDERTEQTSYQPVLGIVSKHQKYQLVKITLESGDSIEATAGHPFYVQGKGWNVAANLKVGEVLRLYNGVTVVIKAVDTSVRSETVYNLSVANFHNYFVGSDGVLVHNSLKDLLKNGPYKPTQSARRMDLGKVDALAEKMKGGNFDWNKMDKKIMIDPDGNIMDGHHRVMAATKAGVEIPEEAIHRHNKVTTRPAYDWCDVLP
ncbi:MAG: hypothetical protein BWK78_09460 [Thiotrichaceae bacterium IS1]|nr:MAG: hypothetical protein BWK78_09460 [Thiotrichaceae bacterium IS1]